MSSDQIQYRPVYASAEADKSWRQEIQKLILFEYDGR